MQDGKDDLDFVYKSKQLPWNNDDDDDSDDDTVLNLVLQKVLGKRRKSESQSELIKPENNTMETDNNVTNTNLNANVVDPLAPVNIPGKVEEVEDGLVGFTGPPVVKGGLRKVESKKSGECVK